MAQTGTWHSRTTFLAVYVRIAFASYAIGICGLGVALLGWGPALAGGIWAQKPWQLASMLRLVEMGLVAMAGLAAPLALAEDHRIRLKALPWFAAVHLLIAVVIASQLAVWDDEGMERVMRVSVIVAFGFTYLWLWSSGRIHPIPEDVPVKGMLETEEARMMGVLRVGACGYLRKDSEPELLLAAVRAVAAGGTYVDASVAIQLVRSPAGANDLSARELEVLRALASGRSNKEIATTLFVSEETVKTHVGHILGKLQVENRSQAIVQALKRGLLTVGELDDA